jgi:DNA polymerase-3 subunit beta
MNLSTPREPFLQHLQQATSVCPTRSMRPLLTDVLIAVEGNRVEFTATDGEVSIRRRFTQEGVSGDGTAALPAATLLQAVRSIADAEISIAQSDQTHELKSERAYFKLNGDDPDLFPSIPTIEEEQGVEVPLNTFVDLCGRTMFAASKDMGRYAFNGVLIELDPEGITLVATDGRRLALASLAMETGVSERRSAVVPLKGLQQLQRLTGDDEGASLRIVLRQSLVAFRTEDAEVLAQLVEGEFPDFRAVVPDDDKLPSQVHVNRDELSSAISRAMITAGDEAPVVRLGLSEGQLTVLSRQEGLGESRSDVPVDYSGEEVEIRFNPIFLNEYLKTMTEDQVSFRFKDRSFAGVFSSNESSRYVVMPITS